MRVDVYDTYATGPTGCLIHIDFVVPAGTTSFEVERLVHAYVGGIEPEIEAECVGKGTPARDEEMTTELNQQGFSVQSHFAVGWSCLTRAWPPAQRPCRVSARHRTSNQR